jgi:chemotaxis protein MotB
MATTPGEKAKSTIVIKRIKKGGHGGHSGGAWKIAYADFVTAMMAFFLLMWLLGSTTTGDKRAIADYFQTPLHVTLLGGSGSGEATSLIPGGGKDIALDVGQIQRTEDKKLEQRRKLDQQRQDEQRMKSLQKAIEAAIDNNPQLAQFKDQVRIDITPDGLRVQIIDDLKRPMFDIGGTLVKDYLRDILRQIGAVLDGVDNRITLSGHTDSAPYSGGEHGYSNWELSAERANASRRELIAGGMAPAKVARVLGLADSVPLVADDPRSALNRRISIVVLSKEAEERLLKANSEITAGSAEAVEDAIDATKPAGAAAGAPPDGPTDAAADPPDTAAGTSSSPGNALNAAGAPGAKNSSGGSDVTPAEPTGAQPAALSAAAPAAPAAPAAAAAPGGASRSTRKR